MVLEVAFNNIMRSGRHASGFAMRFPRILRIRTDKPVSEIDTVERVEEIYQSQVDKPVEVRGVFSDQRLTQAGLRMVFLVKQIRWSFRPLKELPAAVRGNPLVWLILNQLPKGALPVQLFVFYPAIMVVVDCSL